MFCCILYRSGQGGNWQMNIINYWMTHFNIMTDLYVTIFFSYEIMLPETLFGYLYENWLQLLTLDLRNCMFTRRFLYICHLVSFIAVKMSNVWYIELIKIFSSVKSKYSVVIISFLKIPLKMCINTITIHKFDYITDQYLWIHYKTKDIKKRTLLYTHAMTDSKYLQTLVILLTPEYLPLLLMTE